MNTPVSKIIRLAMPAMTILWIILSAILTSCKYEQYNDELSKADSLMNIHPDSSLIILNSIDSTSITDRSEKARYALLMSMALDKNYIDTTDFSILQPAIDYYLDKGTPDEKLRTYYYQGRIFYNRDDHNESLQSFTKGCDLGKICKDSSVLAKAYVWRGILLHEFYDFDGYIDSYIHAYKIYNALSDKKGEFNCLLDILNGAMLKGDKEYADSILNLCHSFDNLNEIESANLYSYQLSYLDSFGSTDEITEFFKQSKPRELNVNGYLNLASCLGKFGEVDKAWSILNSISEDEQSCDTLKYQAVEYFLLEKMHRDSEALQTYKQFSENLGNVIKNRFEQKSRSIEEKHKLELDINKKDLEKRELVWQLSAVIIILVIIVAAAVILIRLRVRQRDMAIRMALSERKRNELEKAVKDKEIERLNIENEKAEAERKNSELEREIKNREILRLQIENEKAKTEKKNSILEKEMREREIETLKLEREKQNLQAENLENRIVVMEMECDRLKGIVGSHKELPKEVLDVIRTYVEVMGKSFAGHITRDENFDKKYYDWIRTTTANTNEFMNSIRLALTATHPQFIKHFEDHGLTIDEINYVCLYAIGLNGVAVGKYMNRPSHKNTSSIIRKKLGIDKHDTNLGIYTRRRLKEA